jgi:hypothetical protein
MPRISKFYSLFLGQHPEWRVSEKRIKKVLIELGLWSTGNDKGVFSEYVPQMGGRRIASALYPPFKWLLMINYTKWQVILPCDYIRFMTNPFHDQFAKVSAQLNGHMKKTLLEIVRNCKLFRVRSLSYPSNIVWVKISVEHRFTSLSSQSVLAGSKVNNTRVKSSGPFPEKWPW